jgi:hypothetical protein
MSTETMHNFEQHATISKLGRFTIPDPKFGDFKLSVMPFDHDGEWQNLPKGFKQWETSFNAIIDMIPLSAGANRHYVTIDSKFFTEDDFLRREGVHIDGNFCADPNLNVTTWGGTSTTTTWSGISMTPTHEVVQSFASPYNLPIPIGTYISSEKGGILTVSSEVGCQAWDGRFYGLITDGGDAQNWLNQCTEENKTVLEKNHLYFMSSNTPHETLMIKKGMRRTFMRITLNHEYPNHLIHDNREE